MMLRRERAAITINNLRGERAERASQMISAPLSSLPFSSAPPSFLPSPYRRCVKMLLSDDRVRNCTRCFGGTSVGKSFASLSTSLLYITNRQIGKGHPVLLREKKSVRTSTGISSHLGAKLRDWAERQVEAGCFSWAELSSNDSKTR